MTKEAVIDVKAGIGGVRPSMGATRSNRVPIDISQSAVYGRRIGLNETGDIGDQTIYGYFGSVLRVIKEINEKNEVRIKYRNILFDDKQKERIITNYKAINIVEEEAKKINGDQYRVFLENVHSRLREIERYDRLLATAIGKAIHSHFDKEPILQRLLLVLSQYPENLAFQHLSNNYDDYSKRIESANNTYLARWARVLMDNFLRNYKAKEQNITKIGMYYSRIKNLANEQERKGGVIKEVKFAIEGIKNIMGEDIEAIANAKPAIDISQIKHIMMYPNELIYLRGIKQKVLRGMSEGMWEEFEDVKKKAAKEIVEDLEGGYGDKETSELFKEWGSKGEKGLHDDPQAWANKIDERVKWLMYHWGDVTLEAIKAFARLFAKCKLMLESKFKENYSKVKGKANELLGEEKREPRKTAKEVLGLKSKRRKVFDALITKKRKEYSKVEDDLFGDIIRFMDVSELFGRKLNTTKIVGTAIKNQGGIERETDVAVQLSGRLGKYVRSYDYAILSRLVGSISAIRALERDTVSQGSQIALVILKYGSKVQEKGRLANDALDRILYALRGVLMTNNSEVVTNGR